MMKLRRSSRNSARPALLSLIILSLLLPGCNPPPPRTRFALKDAPEAIELIAKRQYNARVKVNLTGKTLWVYIPLTTLFRTAKVPQKSYPTFEVGQNYARLLSNKVDLNYSVKKTQPTESINDQEFDKEALNKIQDVRMAIREVVLKLRKEDAQKLSFIAMLFCDINSGLLIKEVSYFPDFKKLFAQYISWYEYEHRVIRDAAKSNALIDDWDGESLSYYDISFDEFITQQIEERIKQKFQKPEIDPGCDIRKEIVKVALYTLDIYEIKDINALHLTDALTNTTLEISVKSGREEIKP